MRGLEDTTIIRLSLPQATAVSKRGVWRVGARRGGVQWVWPALAQFSWPTGQRYADANALISCWKFNLNSIIPAFPSVTKGYQNYHS